MDLKTYIESGILELYVAGQLSDQENREVYDQMRKHPEVLQEVLEIEAAVIKLTAAVSPKPSAYIFEHIKKHLGLNEEETKVVSITRPKHNWLTYASVAAAVLLGVGLFWSINQNNALEKQISDAEVENSYLEVQMEDTRKELAATENILKAIRGKDVIAIPLGGQGDFASTYAKVYWNKKENLIYLDAQGLPEAPEGKVYQVWSLTLNPLTPTSLGTIDDFNSDDTKIFNIKNANESQAFGITLEPAGGSETPTLEQLFTHGIVSTT
jgi:anti-sigma-K factor RskA